MGLFVLVLATVGAVAYFAGHWLSETTGPPRLQVTLVAQATGVDALSMDEQVASVLSRSVMGAPDVEHVRAISEDGTTRLIVTASEGVDAYAFRRALSERLGRAGLPEFVDAPRMEPPMESEAAYRATVDAPPRLATHLRSQLASVPGVASVEVCGEGDLEVRVTVRHDQLMAYGLSVSGLVGALSSAGEFEPAEASPIRARPVRFAQALEEVMLQGPNARGIRLADFATIEETSAVPACRAWRGGPVLALAVWLRPGLPDRERTLRELSQLSETLPPGVNFRRLGPLSPERTFEARLPEESTAEHAAGVARTLGEAIASLQGVEDVLVELIGVTLRVHFVSQAGDPTLRRSISEAVDRIPGLRHVWTGSARASVTALERGVALETARALAARWQRFPDVHAALSMEPGEGVALSVQVDRAEAARRGIPTGDVPEAIAAASERGLVVSSALRAEGTSDLVLRVESEDELTQLVLRASDGAPVPLHEVARIEERRVPVRLMTCDLRPCVEVQAFGFGDQTAVRDALQTALEDLELPAGVVVTLRD